MVLDAKVSKMGFLPLGAQTQEPQAGARGEGALAACM